MAKRLIDKLKKKGKVSSSLDKTRAKNISRDIVTVYLIGNGENGNNKHKKDKKIKINKKIHKKAKELTDKINKFRLKNRRLDIIFNKLQNRRLKKTLPIFKRR